MAKGTPAKAFGSAINNGSNGGTSAAQAKNNPPFQNGSINGTVGGSGMQKTGQGNGSVSNPLLSGTKPALGGAVPLATGQTHISTPVSTAAPAPIPTPTPAPVTPEVPNPNLPTIPSPDPSKAFPVNGPIKFHPHPGANSSSPDSPVNGPIGTNTGGSPSAPTTGTSSTTASSGGAASGSFSPASSAPSNGAAPASSGFAYTVVSGDTLSGIAATHGISLSSLEAANPQISNPNLIFPGETVNLHGTSAASGGGVAAAHQQSGSAYTVASGDTLSGIAATHGISLAKLEAMNPQISNPNLIFPGETVNLGSLTLTSSSPAVTAAVPSAATAASPAVTSVANPVVSDPAIHPAPSSNTGATNPTTNGKGLRLGGGPGGLATPTHPVTDPTSSSAGSDNGKGLRLGGGPGGLATPTHPAPGSNTGGTSPTTTDKGPRLAGGPGGLHYGPISTPGQGGRLPGSGGSTGPEFPGTSTYPASDNAATSGSKLKNTLLSLKQRAGWGSTANQPTDPAVTTTYVNTQHDTDPLKIDNSSNK